MVKEAQEEIAGKAIAWCQVRELEINPNNIVCALDNLGLLVEGNLTMREADVLVRCVDCGALLETDVHCDNCGTFHPTRGLR